MVAALSVTRDVSGALGPGTKRADAIALLGQPRKSTPISPPRPAASFPNVSSAQAGAKVSLCDEYRISGLALTPGDPYHTNWNIYPIAVFLTAGVAEAISLPVTAADLTFRSARRYRLRLWYDPRERLVTYEKR